ncbi:MAG TPA: methylmalonyl-CoA mutase family protein [Bacillota bacterium]|nr:methylmalonyl-CoA mutase family protein [Bacillota bacterium]
MPELRDVTTASGLPVPPYAEARPVDPAALGRPGEYPFTRGVYPTMYRGRLWTMRQYAGFGDAEESNRRYHYLLQQGQTGLSVAFDLPTQIGYDSDHAMAAGEVGRVGVAIDSVEDMDRLLAGLPLDKVSISMTINATAATLLALTVAVAEQRGMPASVLSGTLQNDILKEYAARGTYIYPPAPSMRLVTDVIAWCAEHTPRWNPISISGYHMREAGCTAVQEVGFTLADGIAYVEAALARGLPVDSFAPRLSFFFNAQMDVLEEVAKYRAARRLWAKIMKERFSAKDPKSMMLRFHVQTAGSALTAQQVDNNVVRVALQALAAVLGGCQSLHTNAKDEALALPTEESVRVALRTQQIIASESGAALSADPLAGSYYVEELTDRIETEAAALIARLDAMGGAVPAIARGVVQREIQESAYRTQREIEAGERVVIGVNAYTVEEGPPSDILRIDPELEARQVARLAGLRARRDGAAVSKALAALEKAAADPAANLMPMILDAVRAFATVGEVADTLRRVFGEYAAPSPF